MFLQRLDSKQTGKGEKDVGGEHTETASGKNKKPNSQQYAVSHTKGK